MTASRPDPHGSAPHRPERLRPERLHPERLRSPRFVRAARWWARRELRRTLDGLRVAGLPAARALVADRPVILASTHVAFWDVFVALVLDGALEVESYAVMDAENLCRIPFFTRLGAIPVRRGSPRAGLQAAAALLDRPGRVVWIFPQGGHRPPHLRPLGFQPGVRLLARLAPQAAVVPVGLQYAFAESQGPVAYASFGAPLDAATVAAEGGVERLEGAVVEQLERIDRCLAGAAGPFEVLVPSGSWGDQAGLGHRLLNWWLGPRVPADRRSP